MAFAAANGCSARDFFRRGRAGSGGDLPRFEGLLDLKRTSSWPIPTPQRLHQRNSNSLSLRFPSFNAAFGCLLSILS